MIIIDKLYKWDVATFQNCTIYSIGNKKVISDIKKAVLENNNSISMSKISSALQQPAGNFAVILENDKQIIAFVDPIRSYPVFYFYNENEFYVSNSATLLKEQLDLQSIDHVSLTEFCMAGYVTGKETIYNDLFQLQAGEVIIWKKRSKTIDSKRYFLYKPHEEEHLTEKDYLKQLDNIINKIFRQIIKNAKGAPIWIPLSGGLDSRIIISKLVELGYDNIRSYSYGPKGNYEAKAAQRVAKLLHVPWVPIYSKKRRARKIFNSNSRREYFSFSSGLCSAPVMNDFESLTYLLTTGKMSKDAIIINGQSGDFITGAHIPLRLIQGACSTNQLLDAIVSKHYAIWNHLKSDKNIDEIHNKIREIIGFQNNNELSMAEIAALYELWEWQSRQSKFVVNGQRVYDFFGLKWELPLWDITLMKFYARVPLKYRLGQNLYIKYLENYNYKNLFKGYRSENRRWPGRTYYISKIGSFILSKLNKDQDSFYRYLSYFGHYHDLYSLFDFKYFRKYSQLAHIPPQGRGVVALIIFKWLQENNIKNNIYESISEI